jgi:hypothetical protein
VPRRRALDHVRLHHLEQLGVILRGGLDLGLGAAGKLQDLERARRIEPLDLGGIDRVRLLAPTAPGRRTPRLVEPLAQVVQAECGPGSADLQHRSAAALDEAEGRMRVGHRTDLSTRRG